MVQIGIPVRVTWTAGKNTSDQEYKGPIPFSDIILKATEENRWNVQDSTDEVMMMVILIIITETKKILQICQELL